MVLQKNNTEDKISKKTVDIFRPAKKGIPNDKSGSKNKKKIQKQL